MKIKDIVKEKGPTVFSIDPDRTVKDAIETLVNHGVGSLLVVEDAVPIGIFTERDILQLVCKDASVLGETSIRSVMSTELIIGRLDDDVESALSVMTEKHIRHLPIVEAGYVAGMVSIGDLVKSQLNEQTATITYLSDYIAGTR